MKSATPFVSFVRTYGTIAAAICLLAIYQTQLQTQALMKFRTRYKWVFLMVFFAINAGAALYAAWRKYEREPQWPSFTHLKVPRFATTMAGFVLILLPVPMFLYARADFFGRGSEAFFRLLWLFWWLALAQALGWKLAGGASLIRGFLISILLDGIAAQLFTLSTAVSNYPFSLGWSEASRYYYGSLIFATSVYGERVPLSVMHGSRYLLQSIPFVIKGTTLWFARLWQVLLWVGLTAGAAWALLRRLAVKAGLDVALAVGWLFLYFLQGAVYYHLQVCVIIVMLAVSIKHPWRSVVAVAAASFWAGMSRVNWFPVPALLAIALYVLEKPFRRAAEFWGYWKVPVLWGVVGLALALAGQAFYVAISGNTNLEAFASSFTSALLWYRWFPSPTNSIGIIPGVLIVSLPLSVLVVWKLRSRSSVLAPLRLAGLAAMLLVLLAGGLVVSTKIGGGGDLHNMDAYMVLLAVLGLYAWRGPVASEQTMRRTDLAVPSPIVVLITLVPVAFALLRLANPVSYDSARAEADLSKLGQEVGTYAKSGEVLFMYERHLLTFAMVPKIHLVPEYEVVTLMEMAISGNEPYLQKYYDDLAAHRFAAIVAHTQNLGVETLDFIEENDAWSRLIAQPLLCQYKPALTLDYSNIQILIPRERPCTEFPPRIEVP